MKYSLIHNHADGKTHYGFNWCLDANGLEMAFCVPIVNLTIYLRIRSEEVMEKQRAWRERGHETPDLRRVIFDITHWKKQIWFWSSSPHWKIRNQFWRKS